MSWVTHGVAGERPRRARFVGAGGGAEGSAPVAAWPPAPNAEAVRRRSRPRIRAAIARHSSPSADEAPSREPRSTPPVRPGRVAAGG